LQGVPVDAVLYSWIAAQRVLMARLLDRAGELSPADLRDATRRLISGSFIGAPLAEWLATGRGLGYRMLADGTTFQYDDLLASVVALTVVCTVFYLAVGVLQSFVLARFGPNA
jgi:hypothetical protein